MSDNPFERYDLDPHGGIAAITERLKELVEAAGSDAEREGLRAAWEELTLHPARRLTLALLAHPETRPPLGGAPPRPRRRAAPRFGLVDLAALPSALESLPRELVLRAIDPSAPPPPGDDPTT
ncbi:MAG: hypothetical protein R3B36_08745 [Polyangiaceae bacterium]